MCCNFVCEKDDVCIVYSVLNEAHPLPDRTPSSDDAGAQWDGGLLPGGGCAALSAADGRPGGQEGDPETSRRH